MLKKSNIASENIIYEIGLNHLGKIRYLKQYIDYIIKNKLKNVSLQFRERNFYKTNNIKLENHLLIKELNRLRKNKITIGFSVVDKNFVDHVGTFKPDFFKVLSWGSDASFIEKNLLSYKRKIFISLGMSNNNINALHLKYKDNKYINYIYTNLDLKDEALQLESINLLKKKYNIKISYGHHIPNTHRRFHSLPIMMASTLNVEYIFLYIKIDRNKIHRDEVNAFYLENIPTLIEEIDQVKKLLGSGNKLQIKKPTVLSRKFDLNKYIRIIFDFDGVFTDNKVYVDSNGIESVRADRADGLGINMLFNYIKKHNFKLDVFILSQEVNKATSQRAKKLKVKCYKGVNNKLEFVANKYSYKSLAKTIYFGNDMNDYDLMSVAGFSFAPNDAHPEIKKIASVVLDVNGGSGFVRKGIEYILNEF